MTLEESIELERLKHAFQCELERQKAEYAQKIPAMAGAFSYASETIRSLILLNGGAAIALLSFVGNAIAKYTGVDPSKIGHSVGSLRGSLTYFLFGLALAASASALSYLSQIFFNERILPIAASNLNRAEWARIMAIAFALTSIVMFAFGSVSSANSLEELVLLQGSFK